MKTKIILACCILVNYSIIYAMELAPTIQDIPKLSLADINALSDKKRDQLYKSNNKQLSRSLTFNVALLHKELIHTILTHMLDGNEKSAELFYNAPLWYAYKRYDEAQKMIQKSSLIKQPIALLFRLPVEQQKEIMALVTQSLPSKLIDSRLTISENDHLKIKLYENEIQENFFAGEDIGVMTDYIVGNSRFQHRQHVSDGMIIGGLCGAFMAILIAFTSDPKMSHTLLTPVLGVLGATAGWIGGGIYETRVASKLAQKIDI